jgi:tetratricopeptide (TPR) repeat protein
MQKIFFSYSWKDHSFAMKLYSDLIKAGLSVWRDEVDISYNDQIDQIYNILPNCDFQLILDSTKARKSKWVINEFDIFSNIIKKNPNKKIVRCTIDPIDKLSSTEFTGIESFNLIKAFDFSLIGTYDNEGKYKTTLSKLLNFFDLQTSALSLNPTESDFENEISHLNISQEERDLLLSDFDIILKRINGNYLSCISRIQCIKSDIIELLNGTINVPASILLLLGTEYGRINNHIKAKEVFENFVIDYPYDPRGYRGLGSVLLYNGNMNDFDDAISAFEKSIELANDIKNREFIKDDNYRAQLKKYHKLMHFEKIPESKHNIAQVYLAQEKYSKALKIFDEIKAYFTQKETIYPKLFIDIAYCYSMLNQLKNAVKILESGLEYFISDFELNLMMGQILFELKTSDDISNLDKNSLLNRSAYHYEIAIKFSSKTIKIMTELACIYYELINYHHQENLRLNLDTIVKETKKYFPQTIEDNYYYGLTFYLSGDKKKAKNYFEKSEDYSLPYYSDLFC